MNVQSVIVWGVKKFFIVFICLWSFAFAVEHAVNRASPPSRWIFNVSVEPVNPINLVPGVQRQQNPITARIQMQSVRTVYSAVDVEHHDILYCKVDGTNWRFVSQQIVNVVYIGPTYVGYDVLPEDEYDKYELKSGQWEYTGQIPTAYSLPQVCKIVANMKWSPSPMVTKRAQVVSANFRLVANDSTEAR